MARAARCLILICLLCAGSLVAEPIKLEPVQATTDADSRFAEAVDGIESPENGWRVPQATAHTGIFRCATPVEAGRVRFWLAFEGAEKNSYFSEFSISATTDPNPSSQSQWETIFPTAWDADQGWLARSYPHVRMQGTTTKANARIDGLLSQERVTGIRIEVWPSPAAQSREPVLTELRMERNPMGTTNVALGCPVSASHALAPNQYAEFLTDGLASYAYPAAKDLGPAFYFEIDLRRIREIDHIAIRGRSEAAGTNRFANLLVQLFDEPPSADTPPAWTGQEREPDSVQEPGAVKILRSSAGEGVFRGRYLRIFSTSTAPFSPQLAEVEVYESIVPPYALVVANDRVLPSASRVRIPADSNWLGFAPAHPPLPDGMVLGRRWRIVGAGDEWLPAPSTGVIDSRALPPGEYLFEAQLRHSDQEWNSASLRVPLIVIAPWWKNPWAQLAAALAAAGIAALAAWQIARRRMARRLAELERTQALSRERARIARNMHDVVGARLTQLTVMHEIVAAQATLPPEARAKLDQLTATARAAVSSLDEAVWAINPRNDTLQNVADYLCHAAANYLRPLDIGLRQDVPDAWPAREVVSQKRHELFLAFKEALQNVVKHAAATAVTLTLRLENSELVVWIDDNGRGMPPEVEGTEKDGLENMRARLAAVGGTCTVQTRHEGGTRVELRLPV